MGGRGLGGPFPTGGRGRGRGFGAPFPTEGRGLGAPFPTEGRGLGAPFPGRGRIPPNPGLPFPIPGSMGLICGRGLGAELLKGRGFEDEPLKGRVVRGFIVFIVRGLGAELTLRGLETVFRWSRVVVVLPVRWLRTVELRLEVLGVDRDCDERL